MSDISLSDSISVLGMTLRTTNYLKNLGILTVQDLVSLPVNLVSNIRGIGKVSVKEINRALEDKGLKLKNV